MSTLRDLAAIGTLVGALAGTVGCVDIDGGAVELSWSLRAFAGAPVSCEAAGVGGVRLCWRAAPLDEPLVASCEDASAITFDCDDQHGSSRFELPSGRTGFLVEPICRDGDPAAPGTYEVPAPIVREVVEGEVVTLSSLAIIVSNNSKDPKVCGPNGTCTCER